MNGHDRARALYLDDDALVRRAVSRSARRLATELTTVGTVSEARDALAAGRFDLVLCDWYLDRDRRTTSAELVRALAAEGVPVVVVTGHPERARSALGSIAPVVGKPLDFERLRALLSRGACLDSPGPVPMKLAPKGEASDG